MAFYLALHPEIMEHGDWNLSGKYVLYNSGVFIISRGIENKVFIKREIKTKGLPYLIEQTTMNYNINDFKIPIGKLDIKHNAMYYFKEPGNLIHFANIHNRLEEMENFK